MEELSKDKILNKIDEISDDMIEGIKRIVKIDSVQGEACENAPFGVGVKQALDETLKLCGELGFDTVNVDNYAGYATYGSGDDYICVMGHLDVVPEGVGWKHPPFSAYEEDGYIYSRGILDNKGPVLSCLYALYALKELGFNPAHEIRIIFGCNEETGFNDLKYYLEHNEAPLMGFTPDCKYPVVYAERGRAQVSISGDANKMDDFFQFVNSFILNAKPTGEKFGIDTNDAEFGLLEVRNYQIHLDNNIPSVTLAIRYPPSITKDEILSRMSETCAPFKVEITGNFNPVRFEKDCRLVNTLKETYEAVTGEDGAPVTTTGGTYAKMMPNIVPFGPSFPGQKGIGHNPNEWMKISDIILNAKIYALSLYELGR